MQYIKITEEYFAAAAKTEAVCLDTAWSEKQIVLFASDINCAYFVAVDGGTLYGICSAVFSVDDGEILNIAVLPEKRRLGVGRALLECVFAEAEARGVHSVVLEVASRNEGALALYSALGFSKAGVRKGFYSRQRDDAVIMTKEI